MKRKHILILILSSFLFTQIKAQDSTTTKKKERHHVELSFGQTLLFISNSKQYNLKTNHALVVPTNALLFFAELRAHKKLRIPLFLNIATETKQFLINGNLISEKASPTFGSGMVMKAFQIKIDDKSKIEFELGPLLSCVFDSKNEIRIAPIIAGRFRIMRGEDFVMYFGASYSIGINAFGLLYGTGTVF